MDAAGTLTTLHSFTDSDGRYPVAELMQASDGRIYGTTYQGGASENGTVFRIDAAGRLTTLHSFTSSNGGHWASLMQASDGSFYGTTESGGDVGAGVVC